MDPQRQRYILNSLHSSISRSLVIQPIFSHLHEQQLLSDHEEDILLNPYHTRSFKINHLLRWIPMNGRDALHKFILCLQRSSDDAIGHRELALLLEEAYNRHLDDELEEAPHREPLRWGEVLM